MDRQETCIAICRNLLVEELSAVETYGTAMGKFGDAPERAVLEGIRVDHSASASILRNHLQEMGVEGPETGVVWDDLNWGSVGTIALIGDSPTLVLLERGERRIKAEYLDAMSNEAVMEKIKDDVRSTLVGLIDGHLKTLGRLASTWHPASNDQHVPFVSQGDHS